MYWSKFIYLYFRGDWFILTSLIVFFLGVHKTLTLSFFSVQHDVFLGFVHSHRKVLE